MAAQSPSKILPPVFAKLNLQGHQEILMLHAPDVFEKAIDQLEGIRVYRRIEEISSCAFALAFVNRRATVNRLTKALAAKTAGDVVLWFAYPKGTSKNYTCDFNRDDGWELLHELGFDSVRQVAIDEDWSALRFRRVEFIKRSSR